MWVTAGQNVLNVIGNCLLLFGLCGFPKLGVVGVAISGIVSRVAASVALWFVLEWRTRLRMRARDFFVIQWASWHFRTSGCRRRRAHDRWLAFM
jgi:Na+-driven multidrug efflux pump